MVAQSQHDPLVIQEFHGLYARNNSVGIPLGYCKELINLLPGDGSLLNRNQIAAWQTITTLASSIQRIYATLATDNTRFLIVVHDGLNSRFYDTVQAAAIVSLGVVSLDFNFVRIGTRQYFFPHTGGIPYSSSAGYYVFDPTVHTAARIACGSAPASAPTVTVAGGAGTKNISVGVHLWAVVYETDTGHITAVAASSIVAATHAGQMADLSNIPTGPAGTVSRHILVSKVIPNYDNNELNYELFFLPNGEISNNVTTILANVEFYDSELSDSADYLKDILQTPPASIGACTFGNRLVTWGGNSHTLTISERGKPETFNTTTGVCEIDPGYGKGITNCVEQDGALVVFKDIAAYVITDNDGEPNTWVPAKVDGSLGTGPHGICLGYGGNPCEVQHNLLVLTRGGLYQFNGGFDTVPLTRDIDAYYAETISNYVTTSDVGASAQCYVDPLNKLIYILYPGVSESIILVGDYKKGLDPDNIRWTKFAEYAATSPSNPLSVKSIGILNLTANSTTAAGGAVFLITDNGVSNATKKIWYYNADSAVPRAYLWALETGELPHNGSLDDDTNIFFKMLYNLYSGVLQPTNGTKVVLTIGGTVVTDTAGAGTITLSSAAGELVKEVNANVVGRRPTIRLEVLAGTATPAYLSNIRTLILYGLPSASARPL